MKIDGNEIKVGNILEINNKLWKVLKTQHTQPGKGGAYLQAELKEIREGTKMNSRFRSSETVERAILDEKEFQYLYDDNNNFIFMDKQTYEQIELGSDILTEDQSKFLVENCNVIINFYNEKPVGIDLPDTLELTVVETEGSKPPPPSPTLKFPANTIPGMPKIKPRGEPPFEPHGGHATGDSRTAGGSRRRRRRRRTRRRKNR